MEAVRGWWDEKSKQAGVSMHMYRHWRECSANLVRMCQVQATCGWLHIEAQVVCIGAHCC